MWYGRCGRDPKFGDERHILNCLYEGPPKRAPAADVDKARSSEFRQQRTIQFKFDLSQVSALSANITTMILVQKYVEYLFLSKVPCIKTHKIYRKMAILASYRG